MNTLEEHEKVFAERKRKARVIDALKSAIEGAKLYEMEDFIDVVGRFMLPDEDTYDARRRLLARVAELTDALGSDMAHSEASELADLLRLARHQGADWKKAKERHRAEKGEAIPSQPWGNDDEMNARREAVHAERRAAKDALEARLAALEAQKNPAG
jgi:hypothetical protein